MKTIRAILKITFAAIMVMSTGACAPSSESKNASATATRQAPDNGGGGQVLPPPPEPFCFEQQSCANACALAFPFATRRAIERAASAAGNLCSGVTLLRIAQNELSVRNHTACLGLLVNDVDEFIASPMTILEAGVQISHCGMSYP